MDGNIYPIPIATSFATLDWVVLGGYFVVLAVSGVLLSWKKQEGTEDYFLGGRSMPMWAVAFSVLATSQSAATFIGAPESSYKGNLTFLSFSIGQIVAALVVAFVFLPVFYRHKVATVYELLERKVGTPSKLAASWMFMIGRLFASGARLFMGSLAMAMILYGDIQWWQVCAAIGVMTLIGIFYTLIGGIRSIIWTDVIQTFVYVGAAVAALVVLMRMIPADTQQIMSALSETNDDGTSKLTWLKFDLDPAQPFTLWTAVLGFALLNIGFFGTDQDGTQRMLTCKSSAHASRSMLSAVILGIPVTFLFMAVGLLLWVFYSRPDLMGDAAPEAAGSSMKIFLQFIMTHMPPGMSGLMMAGLIAAGLSSLNSALNAMSSTFVNDFYRHKWRDRGEEHYLFVGRAGVMVGGVILGLFGVLCFFWKQSSDIPLVDFALLVMAFAYSGLVAVFLTVMLTNRGSNLSVIAALVVGFLIVLVMQKAVWTSITPQSWHDLKIAFPWQMLLATLIAFAVCCLGKQPRDL